MLKIPSTVVLISVGVLGLGLGYRYITSPPGYCRNESRYISDAEFLRATIRLLERDMNSELVVLPENTRGKKKELAEIYKNWDFNAKSPNCCAIRRDETFSIVNRIFGLQEVHVLLNSRTSTQEVGGDNLIDFRWSVCGVLKESGIGLPNSQHELITIDQ